MRNNNRLLIGLFVALLLVICSLFIGCSYKNVTTPIHYDEHQGMKLCEFDNTWYNANLIDLVCKDEEK